MLTFIETYIEYQFRDEENDYTVGNWEPSSPLQFHDGTHRRYVRRVAPIRN